MTRTDRPWVRALSAFALLVALPGPTRAEPPAEGVSQGALTAEAVLSDTDANEKKCCAGLQERFPSYSKLASQAACISAGKKAGSQVEWDEEPALSPGACELERLNTQVWCKVRWTVRCLPRKEAESRRQERRKRQDREAGEACDRAAEAALDGATTRDDVCPPADFERAKKRVLDPRKAGRPIQPHKTRLDGASGVQN
jgi:hypothetical protein